MRLLFVTSSLARGGAEGFLVRLATRLAARRFVCAVASFGSRAPLAMPLAAAGIEVVSLGDGVIRPLLRLRRFARRFRPNVVQGWMYRGNLAALLAVLETRERPALLWSVRQGLNDLPTSPWTTKLSVTAGAWLSRRPFTIVYNAESAERQHAAAGYAPARSRVIPNGIEVAATSDPGHRIAVRTRLKLSQDAFVVALLARWHPVKNHRGFVRAAGRFARSRPEARFLLAGSGIDPANTTLASWLREEGISDRALLLGERSDVSDLLEAADIATLASHGEALPNAILEAMALGVPCVAPDVGDIAALIGTTGVVVRADDPAALAEGWEMLAAMTGAERRALGERARERSVSRYGLEHAVDTFEALYEAAADS